MFAKLRITLGWQIIIGLIIGATLGTIFYHNKPFIAIAGGIGSLFINLISMLVIPIVTSSLIVGISSLGDLGKIGRIGVKTLVYFEVLSTIAFILGLVVANIINLGSMLNLHQLSHADISTYIKTAQSTKESGPMAEILSIIPANVFRALTDGKMIPIVFFSALFGVGVASVGKEGEIITKFLKAVANVMFRITGWVMQLSPIGVAGLIGSTIATLGLGSLRPLALFILLAYATMIAFVLVILGITSKIFGFNIIDQLKAVKHELILAFTTASSEVTLPLLIKKTQKLGVSPAISSFVIPTGYTFNLDGSAIYQSLAIIFLAQAYHINLSISQQVMLLLVLMLTSKGTAGVPGASFVVLLATISTIGIPPAGIAIIAGIDRLVDMGRTTVNVIGNVTATLVIAKSEKEFSQTTHDNYLKQLD